MSLPSIRLTDTLTGKEVLLPKREHLSLYGCGPTVYGLIHVGNARAFLVQELVVRTLRYAGYKVTYARNYTDIDDKIIDRAKRENRNSEDVAQEFRRAFDEDMKALGALSPDHRPAATENIPAILSIIEKLVQKGLAYTAKTSDGTDVYFRVSKFSGYGKLSKRKLDDMIAGARVEPGEAKEHPADFALWKAAKEGEPFWESLYGRGRPGWHIECSAMIESLFHDTIDIHLGGLDLIFPHHENEVAQSEGCFSRPLSHFWVHNGMLEFNHEKMSKSLGNIMTLREFLSRYGGETLRLLTYQTHYRGPLDFSDENILRAEGMLNRLYHCKQLALEAADATEAKELPSELLELRRKIDEALYDDFGSAKALGLVMAAARTCFREQKRACWKAWLEVLLPLEQVFGILTEPPEEALRHLKDRRLDRMGMTESRAKEIDGRLKVRELLRSQKKFKEADEIRADLEREGILVMDGPDGSEWTVK